MHVREYLNKSLYLAYALVKNYDRGMALLLVDYLVLSNSIESLFLWKNLSNNWLKINRAIKKTMLD